MYILKLKRDVKKVLKTMQYSLIIMQQYTLILMNYDYKQKIYITHISIKVGKCNFVTYWCAFIGT